MPQAVDQVIGRAGIQIRGDGRPPADLVRWGALFVEEVGLRLIDIHHVAVICSDYASSKRFYTEVLGLPVAAETYRAARDSYKLDLQVGPTTQIELFSFPDPPPRPSRPEACGLRHLAFAVADLDAAVAELSAQGIAVEPIRIDELTDRRFTFFADPDGLPLELYEA